MTESITTLNLSPPPMEGLPARLAWLADAPLYIDADQVGRFYDAVVRPQVERGDFKLVLTEDRVQEIQAKLGLEAGVEPGGLLGDVLGLFVKPSIKASAEGNLNQHTSDGKATEITLREIDTPQRQLEQLILHYLVNRPSRIFLPTSIAAAPWRDPQVISQVPRAIAFLDFPSRSEADSQQLVRTKLIPMAAEFENGVVDPIFTRIEAKSGERAPAYPEGGPSDPKLGSTTQMQDYWKWFDQHFSATRAMELVERAASGNGRIRWIDYRVPLTPDGHTLHLHISPATKYDTGVFAYNFIKRGLTHGVRLVGTMKSGPDMNVLAIYEK